MAVKNNKSKTIKQSKQWCTLHHWWHPTARIPLTTHGKPDAGHLMYNNLWVGIISSISQMRKLCFREDKQPAKVLHLDIWQMRSEYRFFLQSSYIFYSFSLLLLKTAHRFNWFFFQKLILEITHWSLYHRTGWGSSWELESIFGKALCMCFVL